MTAREAPALAGVIALVEKFGTLVLAARALDPVTTTDVRAALHVAGVLSGAPAATSWPCDVRGCSREIRSNYDGARKPLVAICCQAPAACMPVELAFEDVAQLEIAVDALVSTACELLGAQIDRAALATLRERRPIGEARPPVLVATLEEPPRDVFWTGSPRDTDLASFCARRERVARGSLVLVPSTKYVALEVAARFAPGEHVEIRALGDALCVRAGRLGLATPVVEASAPAALAPVPAPVVAVPSAVAHGLAARLGVTRWEEIRILPVDTTTVRIEANGQSLLRTFVELGFVDGRKKESVTPITAWGLLLLFCKRGRLRPSEYGELGKRLAAKKSVEVLGRAMRGAFGIEAHPIRPYSKKYSRWKPRFLVGAVKEDATL